MAAASAAAVSVRRRSKPEARAWEGGTREERRDMPNRRSKRACECEERDRENRDRENESDRERERARERERERERESARERERERGGLARILERTRS